MHDLHISRRHLLAGVGAMSMVGVLGAPATVVADDDDNGEHTVVRWDIVSLGANGISAGGHADATAQDGSAITLTGSGTFRPGHTKPVTGGGTWTATGAVAGSGTYKVTGLVSFVRAPGTLTVADNIGKQADASSGLAFLTIAYSNGMAGVLTVSCHLAAGAPNTIFEGIRVSMGFVDFWNGTAPVAGVDANRTVFHITQTQE
jgi:hypothetical protein